MDLRRLTRCKFSAPKAQLFNIAADEAERIPFHKICVSSAFEFCQLTTVGWTAASRSIPAVLLLYFFIIIFIGLYMGRKEDNLEDFALGGRRIPWWAVLASIIAAETSAGTFFGTPGEGFALRNYTYLQLALGTILARILVSYIFIKPYYDYKVFSIYEYLTARFGVRDEERRLGGFHDHASARLRRAALCRLPSPSRSPTK